MRKSRGQMDRKVSFEGRTVTVDGYGDATEAWAVVKSNVPAHVQEVTISAATLSEMADQEQFLQKAVFTINFPRTWSIDKDAVIVYNNLRWKMTSMVEIGRRDQMRITATATDSTILD